MTGNGLDAEIHADMRKLRKIVLLILGILLVICMSFYAVTYHHPIVLGSFPSAEAEEACMRYSHTLMGDFLGIPIHAQLILIASPGEFRMVSFLPPWRTTVYHAEGDIPYWEHWK